MQCPSHIANARVVYYTVLDARHRHTQANRHIVEGSVLPAAKGLAICQYPGETAFYLFSCDAQWNPKSDTWHQTLVEAQAQAEHEYRGTSGTWQLPVGKARNENGVA
jgi:hypothetical protein